MRLSLLFLTLLCFCIPTQAQENSTESIVTEKTIYNFINGQNIFGFANQTVFKRPVFFKPDSSFLKKYLSSDDIAFMEKQWQSPIIHEWNKLRIKDKRIKFTNKSTSFFRGKEVSFFSIPLFSKDRNKVLIRIYSRMSLPGYFFSKTGGIYDDTLLFINTDGQWVEHHINIIMGD